MSTRKKKDVLNLAPQPEAHGHAPLIGMKLVDRSADAHFLVDMYYGEIADDSLRVVTPEFEGQTYLRFKLSFIGTRKDRRGFAESVHAAVKDSLSGAKDVVYTDSYVCGSPANSFFVVSYPFSKDAPSFTLEASKLAALIAGVPAETDFEIDGETFKYEMTTSSTMRVSRKE